MAPLETRVLAVDREHPDPAVIDEAAALVRRGGLVAFPTETVYGLGAHALDAAAVARVFAAKGRPSADPLIVHVGAADEVARVARAVPPLVATLAARFWPGPLTLILPKRAEVPGAVTAGLDTVAVRVPSHPVARALLAQAGVPIAAPSANRFARPSPTRAAHVLADLAGRIDLVLDAGPTDVGVESTVLDLTVWPPVVRRPGGVALEVLTEVVPDLRPDERYAAADVAQPSPGQSVRHYAPRARVTLYAGPADAALRRLAADARRRASAGTRVGVLAPEDDLAALAPDLAPLAAHGRVITQPYGARSDVPRAAHELFDALRTLDARGVDEILATAPLPEGLGRAIHDRLRRAAEGRVVSAG
ncbi:MAG: L-threonylcarbamoyladenylate synthase [Acidobacteriota bacterium]